ncbi:MAG: hypothetical protein QW416_01860 [Candidatus Nitrosocaldaceae archaeon]
MDIINNIKTIELLINQFNKRLHTIENSKELLRFIRYSNNHSSTDNGSIIAIDGSMDYEERLEMLFFYVNAMAYSANLTTKKEVRFGNDIRRSSIGISSIIPLWYSDISNIVDESDEFDARYNLDKIPYMLMTMAELYSAYNAVNVCKDLKLIILDRALIRTFASLIREVKKLIRIKRSALFLDTRYGKVSLSDIKIAYMLGDGSIYVPARGAYAKYAIIKELLDGEKSRDELAKRLRIDIDKHIKYLKDLDIFDRTDSTLKLSEYTKNYWQRISSVTNTLINNIFNNNEYPFVINDKWLTLLDISALNLFLLYELIGKVLKENILMIGIVKDMNTTEFIRAIMPYYKIILQPNILSNDRALFTMLSATHNIDTPWRSISYDGAFTSLIYDKERDTLKAARKAIFRERLFVRAYFQLRRYKNNLRSPVFMYDRLFYPKFDMKYLKEVEAEEWNNTSKLELFIDGSNIDDLYLSMLANLDSKEIYEAYGHNYLLYLADKAAKADIRHMRSMLEGMVNLYVNRGEIRKVSSLTKSFREQRYDIERARV